MNAVLLIVCKPQVWLWTALFTGAVWIGSNMPVDEASLPAAYPASSSAATVQAASAPERGEASDLSGLQLADASSEGGPQRDRPRSTDSGDGAPPRVAPSATSRPFLGNFLGRFRQGERPGALLTAEEHKSFDEFLAKNMPNTAEALRELASPAASPAAPQGRRDGPRNVVSGQGGEPSTGDGTAGPGESVRGPLRAERRRWLTQTALFQFRRYERGKKDFPELEQSYLKDVQSTDEVVGLLREFRGASQDRRDEIRTQVRSKIASVAGSLIDERRRRIDRLRAQLDKEETAVARDERNLDRNVDKRVEELFGHLGIAAPAGDGKAQGTPPTATPAGD